MHLLKSIVDGHGRGGSIGMRRHNPDDAAHVRVQTGRNDAQNNVFAGEDARNLGMGAWGACCLHDADRGGPALAHETRDFSNGCPWADHRRLGAGIHNGRKVGQGRLFAQSFDVGEHGRCLGIGAKAGAKFALDTRERAI